MPYEIESNVPVPATRHVRYNGVTDLLRAMQVGDSFLIPRQDIKRQTRRNLYTLAVQAGVKIRAQTSDEGVRVWRVAGEPNGGKRTKPLPPARGEGQ